MKLKWASNWVIKRRENITKRFFMSNIEKEGVLIVDSAAGLLAACSMRAIILITSQQNCLYFPYRFSSRHWLMFMKSSSGNNWGNTEEIDQHRLKWSVSCSNPVRLFVTPETGPTRLSSVLGTLQTRILECVAISFSGDHRLEGSKPPLLPWTPLPS